MKKLPLLIIGLSILLTACNSSIFKRGQDSILTSKEVFTGSEGLVFEFFENAPPKEVFEKSPFPVGIRLHNKGACDIGFPIKGIISPYPTGAPPLTVCHSPIGPKLPLIPSGYSEGFLSIGLENDYILPPKKIENLLGANVKLDDPQTITFELTGKDLENSQGEREVITFILETKDLKTLDPHTELRDSTILLTACYKYRTLASADICIDTDIFGFKEKSKACKVEDLELKDQGAPIAITKIEPQMNPEKDKPGFTRPMFIITIENKANGEVIQGNRETVKGACSSTPLGYKKWNRVDITAFVLKDGNQKEQLNCNLAHDTEIEGRLNPLAGVLDLKGKEDKIRCQLANPIPESEGTYLTLLFIELDYGYTQSISRTVKIKKSLSY